MSKTEGNKYTLKTDRLDNDILSKAERKKSM